MIEDLIAEMFETIGYTWNTTEGLIVPESDDVLKLLDAIAKHMSTEPVDREITSAGVIVRKQEDGALATYVYVGDYR